MRTVSNAKSMTSSLCETTLDMCVWIYYRSWVKCYINRLLNFIDLRIGTDLLTLALTHQCELIFFLFLLFCNKWMFENFLTLYNSMFRVCVDHLRLMQFFLIADVSLWNFIRRCNEYEMHWEADKSSDWRSLNLFTHIILVWCHMTICVYLLY